MLTYLQRATAQAIVNVFETGRAIGDYGQVTLLAGDPGHLTYGRSQTTLASGNLFLLVKAYCADADARFGTALSEYLPRLAHKDTTLDHSAELRSLLKQAGEDPVMHDVQDAFFDRVYWNPSVEAASTLGIATPLGTAVVYDSHVHGSWDRIRDSTVAAFGSPKKIKERPWIGHYVDVRRNWLATHQNHLLRKTVYRMDSFRTLIGAANWDLALPINVRGVRIDETTFGAPPLRVSAQDVEVRVLMLQSPNMRGEDVRALQEALVAAGFKVDTDGVFGPQTEDTVTQFQSAKGLLPDGMAGPATRSALRL